MTSDPDVRKSTAVLLVLMGLLLLARPGQAQAQGLPPKQQARALFKKANDLFKRGMYLDALEKYRAAKALYPSFKIDLNIGSTLDSMGRRTEAALYFERFLVQSSSAPPEIIQAARERLSQLKKKLASVKLTSMVEGATISVDGKAVGKTPLELPVYLEPGKHELTAEHTGHQALARKIDLTAGQHISLDLSPRPAPASPPAVETTPAPRVDVGLEERARARRSKTIWAYTTLGAGLALAATAAVLYGVGFSQGSDAHDRYRAATEQDEMDRDYEDVEAAKTKVVVGHVMVGLAVASLGLSVYHFLTRPAAERPTSTRPRGSRFAFAPASGGAMLSVSGGF